MYSAFRGRLIRGSRAGENLLKATSCPACGFGGVCIQLLAVLNHTSLSRLFRHQKRSCGEQGALTRFIVVIVALDFRAVVIGDFFPAFGNCFAGFHERKRDHYHRTRDVVGLQTITIPGTQLRLCFPHRDYATVHGRRSQPSAEKVPVRVAGRKRWRLEMQNTYTAVPGTRIPGTRYQVPGNIGIFSARSLKSFAAMEIFPVSFAREIRCVS